MPAERSISEEDIYKDLHTTAATWVFSLIKRPLISITASPKSSRVGCPWEASQLAQRRTKNFSLLLFLFFTSCPVNQSLVDKVTITARTAPKPPSHPRMTRITAKSLPPTTPTSSTRPTISWLSGRQRTSWLSTIARRRSTRISATLPSRRHSPPRFLSKSLISVI